jgi:hypothetical protein
LYAELEKTPLIIGLKCLSILLSTCDCLQSLHQKESNDCCAMQINEEKEQEQFRERRWRFIVAMLAALLVSVSIAWKEAHYFFLGAFLGLIRL